MKLELLSLNKTFGVTKALDGITFCFEKGICGILGPNGAGKSTMINLITDNLKRDRDGGKILYNGKDILELGKEFRKKLGYMPQQQGFYEQMTAKEFLFYIARIKEVHRKKIREEVDRLIELVGLSDKQHLRIGGFSGGMKQRILLAQALLGDPEILILDEPTAGLDPKERIRLRNFIKEISENKIILFATHVVSDIENTADKIMIIDKGKIVNCGKPVELYDELRGKVAEISCNQSDAKVLSEKYAMGNLRQCKNDLLQRIIIKKASPYSFPENALPVEEINLEDVYLHYFGD